MIEKPTKKELIGLIILGVILFIIVVVTALAISSFKAHNADAHMRNHEYPTPTINPCQEGLTWENPCPTPTIVLEEPTVTREPTLEVSPTAGQSGTPAGDGRSDNLSDGKSSCPSCTEPPKDVSGQVLSSEVGWK